MLPVARSWSDSVLVVEIRHDAVPPGDDLPASGDVEVVARHDAHPRATVTLTLDCGGAAVRVLLLEGNDVHSGVRGRGFGTLVVNTAILYLRTALYPGRPDIQVVGETRPAARAPDPTVQRRDLEGSARFWAGFGFAVDGLNGRQSRPTRPLTGGEHLRPACGNSSRCPTGA